MRGRALIAHRFGLVLLASGSGNGFRYEARTRRGAKVGLRDAGPRSRLVVYDALMTDRYPPLRLDQGGEDPEGPAEPAAASGAGQ